MPQGKDINSDVHTRMNHSLAKPNHLVGLAILCKQMLRGLHPVFLLSGFVLSEEEIKAPDGILMRIPGCICTAIHVLGSYVCQLSVYFGSNVESEN